MENKKFNYKIAEIARMICEKEAKKHLRRAFREWGIERTKEKIEEIYQSTPKLKKFMLRMYQEILNQHIPKKRHKK